MSLGKKLVCIGGLWLTSLVLAGYLGWQASSTVPSQPPPSAPPEATVSQPIGDLDAENGALRRRIEQLAAELARQKELKTPERESANHKLSPKCVSLHRRLRTFSRRSWTREESEA